MKLAVPLLLVAGASILPMFAQEGMTPAPVLNIGRESIKEGKDAAHEKVEGEWAATLRKANFPGHYYAFASMSGTDEVWFIQPMESFAANEEFEKAGQKEPLKGAVEQLGARDGELRTGSRTLWAVYRPDLSYKPENVNMAKLRYVDVGTYLVKLGKEEDFVNGAKAYFGGYGKGNVDVSILGYQVTTGAPAGTYLLFIGMDSMKVLDGEPERMKALQGAIGQDTYSQLMKGLGDVLVSVENNLFEVKPGMSYPPQSVVDADPGFWKPKSTAKAPAQAGTIFPEQKKGQ
jgi:hypothetical protein